MILLILSVNAYSQRYLSHIYTENDGLINSHINDIIQDSTGRMWFATNRGISVYDGSNWKSYSLGDQLLKLPIELFGLDSDSQLYATGTTTGIIIYTFKNGKWEIAYENDSLNKSSRFTAFKITEHHTSTDFYLSTPEDGLFIIKDGKIIRRSKGKNYNISQINGIAEGHKKIYLATNDGLYTISKTNPDSILKINISTPASEEIKGIWVDHNKDVAKIWLAGVNWIGYVRNNEFHLISDNIDFRYILVTEYMRFASDNKDGIYVGNPYDLFHISYDGKEVIKLSTENGLITPGVTALYCDREKNLWVGSLRGVTKIPTRRFANYNKHTGLFDSECSAIIQREDGAILLGHYGGLSIIKGNKIDHIEYPIEEHFTPIELRSMDFELDSEGNLWIAISFYGLIKMSKNGEFEEFWDLIPVGTNTSSVVEIEKGTLLLNTNDKLSTLKDGKLEIFDYPDPFNTSIRKIFRSKTNNKFFIGSYSSGMLELTDGKWTNHYLADNAANNSVYSFLEASDSIRYIGTEGGLCKLEDGKIVKIKGPMEVANPIYNLLEDENKNIWIGTDNGLFKWDGKKLWHLNVEDGLAGYEINRDAMIIDNSGKLWIGTNAGVSVYNQYEDYDPEETLPPMVEIVSIIADNDTLVPDKAYNLDYNQNNITFKFLAISFIDENEVYYKCKLDGFDENWSNEFRSIYNQYRYNNLPPGTYRFKVKARNMTGKWSEAKVFPPLIIKTPFWQQLWFIALVTLIASSTIYFLFRFFAQKKYSKELKEEVEKQTSELRESEKKLKLSNATKDKFFSIIAHDLKGPFNAILGYSDLLSNEFYHYSDKEKIKFIENIRSASSSSYELLDNLLVWALSEEGNLKYLPEKFKINVLIDDVINFLQSSANKKEIKIFNGIVKDVIVFADRNMISTVVRNLISNAIRFTQDKGRISITYQENDDFVEICVEDNGCGIPADKLKDIFIGKPSTKDDSNGGTGLGLVLCKEFVSRNNGTIKVESQVNEGSKFIFTIPAAESKRSKD